MSISKLRGSKSTLRQQPQKQQQQQQRENPENSKSNQNSPINEVTNHTGTTTNAHTAVASVSISATPVAKYVGSYLTAYSNQQQLQKERSQTQQQQQHSTYLPQTSLLKIKPFVPSLNTRLRRPFGRSYSTLSSTYLKRTASTNGHWAQGNIRIDVAKHTESVVVGAAIDRNMALSKSAHKISSVGNLRRHPIRLITHQHSKSTSSSAASSSNRPATAAVNGAHTAPAVPSTNTSCASKCAIVTSQPNGICRIARLPKEQEKLPDRINYDRRGLTAIPIFENESNLRLLSLQHNLINIFHIPKEHDTCNELSDTPPEDHLSQAKPETFSKHSSAVSNGSTDQHRSAISLNRPLSTSREYNFTIGNNAARMPISLSSPISQSNVGSKTNAMSSTPPPPPQNMTTFGGNGHKSQLLKRNYLLQSLNFNAPHIRSTQTQPNHTHFRSVMKKSKSFISNSSRQPHNVRRGASKPLNTKTEAKMLVLLGRTNLKSFDSSASGITNDSMSTLFTSEIEEEDCYEHQLEIKNRQLTPSYGTVFHNLVFLDLYDNQIERVANLDGLPTLSVLLLGKNRITDISGLISLRDTLRVLDLHGNKITSISNKINCLQGLKSLNLAGNQIRQINQNDFNGLLSLKELNLKRNRIRRINGFQHLIALERLWLCHNDIHKVDDMSSIAQAGKLLEVTIENNPVSLAGDCVSFLVSYLPKLQSLSQMPITEQVRHAAMSWRKNKELSEANQSHQSSDVFNNIRREEVISNARTNWELLRSQQTVQTAIKNQRSPKQRELAKISESNETVVGYEDLQEYIKLPPIQQQQNTRVLECSQTQTELQTNEPANDRLSVSSNSSLGPNVDSSSSSYSSDNEETPTKQSVARTRKKKLQRLGSLRTRTSKKQQSLNKENLINEEYMPSKVVSSITNSDEQDLKLSNMKLRPTTINNTGYGNNSPEKANAQMQILSTSNTPSRTPTPITAVTANSGILCLSYNQKSCNASQTSETTSAIPTDATPSNSTPITSMSTTNPTTQTAVTTGSATTPSTTCKRYMRGTLMRSHVVVNSSYGGVGGKMKIPTRSTALQQASTQQNNVMSTAARNLNTNLNVSTTGSSVSNVVTISRPTSNNLVTTKNPETEITTAAPTVIAMTTNQQSTNSIASMSVSINSSATNINNGNNQQARPASKPTATEREREQGGDYLIEICGRYLNIYGQGALRFIDKQWNPAKANDVHTLNFSYINFNNIVTVLARIKVRFPNAENFVFRETNINCLGQLNALAELQGIVSLFIDPEGNVVTTKNLWRQYGIYRLSHWGLKILNGIEISAAAVEEANIMYAGLSDLVLWSMPDVMLQPLLARLRLDETCTASKMSPKDWLMNPENKSLRLVVGKEALQWKKPSNNATTNSSVTITNLGQSQQQCNNFLIYGQQHNAANMGIGMTNTALSGQHAVALSPRERAKLHFTMMMENTCNAVEKLHKLETLWPSLLLDIVRNTLLDYSQLDAYLRGLMSEIMK